MAPSAVQPIREIKTADTLNVYQMIAVVSQRIGATGIAKDRKNEQQHYKFRGVDDVYNALSPILSDVGLVILPRVLSRECVERTTQKGSVLFYVTVAAEFDFVSAHDGSKHTVKTYGEAMDSADKATNKAMSAAYKYAAFQAFCIPTEGDHDADATTHEGVQATVPPGFDEWLTDLESTADNGTAALKAAWTKSQPYLRQHLTTTNPKKWDALKAKADKATVPA